MNAENRENVVLEPNDWVQVGIYDFSHIFFGEISVGARVLQPPLERQPRSEHRQSARASTPCADCHMPRIDGRRDHRFLASRGRATLRRALRVEATRSPGGRVRLRLAPGAVGHAVPTGDLLRWLVVVAEALGQGHEVVADNTQVLGRRFGLADRRVPVGDNRVGARGPAPVTVEPRPGRRRAADPLARLLRARRHARRGRPRRARRAHLAHRGRAASPRPSETRSWSGWSGRGEYESVPQAAVDADGLVLPSRPWMARRGATRPARRPGSGDAARRFSSDRADLVSSRARPRQCRGVRHARVREAGRLRPAADP